MSKRMTHYIAGVVTLGVVLQIGNIITGLKDADEPQLDSQVAVETQNAVPTSVIPPQLDRLINASKENYLVDEFVPSESDDVRGWLLKVRGQSQLYWSAGGLVLSGGLISETGENLTEKYLLELDPPTPVDYASSWEQMKQGTTIQMGTDAGDPDNALYIYYEPYCGACSNLMRRLRPLVSNNLMDVRLVPVAWLHPTSANAIEAMIQGGPESVLAHEQAKALGQPVPLLEPSAKTKKAIIQNGDLMQAMEVKGTPTVFFKNAEGEIVNLGIPNDQQLTQVVQTMKARRG